LEKQHMLEEIYVPAIERKDAEIAISICDEEPPWVIPNCKKPKILTLIDSSVASITLELYPELLKNSFVVGFDCKEENKSVEYLKKFKSDRKEELKQIDALVIIGGGATLNFGTALAKDLYLKLLTFHFILIPTTVLAMADVAYGSQGLLNKKDEEGNLKRNAKRENYDPDRIILDKRYINKLSPSLIKQGLAECLKHALLQETTGPDDFPKVDECIRLLRKINFNNDDNKDIISCVIKTIHAKIAVIKAQNDKIEGAEHLLSYGHVDAEPRESASNFALAHGDAVLLSLAIELKLAGLTDALEKVCSVLSAALYEAVCFDKETMRNHYTLSSKERFRVPKTNQENNSGEIKDINDTYYVIHLPQIGHFASIQPVKMDEYSFQTLYEASQDILALLKQSAPNLNKASADLSLENSLQNIKASSSTSTPVFYNYNLTGTTETEPETKLQPEKTVSLTSSIKKASPSGSQ